MTKHACSCSLKSAVQINCGRSTKLLRRKEVQPQILQRHAKHSMPRPETDTSVQTKHANTVIVFCCQALRLTPDNSTWQRLQACNLMASAECSNATFDVLPVSLGCNRPACLSRVSGRWVVTAQTQCLLVAYYRGSRSSCLSRRTLWRKS